MLNRNYLNIIIDILLLIVFSAVSGIGLLIKYALPSGYAQRHQGIHSSISQWMGMGRHEWGEIHWILSLLLLVLLILHLVLHWKMIGGICRKMIPQKHTRYLLLILLLVIVSSFLLIPLTI